VRAPAVRQRQRVPDRALRRPGPERLLRTKRRLTHELFVVACRPAPSVRWCFDEVLQLLLSLK